MVHLNHCFYRLIANVSDSDDSIYQLQNVDDYSLIQIDVSLSFLKGYLLQENQLHVMSICDIHKISQLETNAMPVGGEVFCWICYS